MTGVIVGFTAFEGVPDNPSAHIATSLDGRVERGTRIVGATMPVSYVRSLERTATLVERHAPDWILGIGVAMRRQAAAFERFGTGYCGERADIDGDCGVSCDDVRPSGLPVDHLAELAGFGVSEDCGSYVCNGWLYGAIERFAPIPVGFLHVPPQGIDVAALLGAVVAPWPEVR